MVCTESLKRPRWAEGLNDEENVDGLVLIWLNKLCSFSVPCGLSQKPALRIPTSNFTQWCCSVPEGRDFASLPGMATFFAVCVAMK